MSSLLNRLGKKRPFTNQLLLNHVDAWQVATIISALALLNHRLVSWKTVLLLPAVGVGYWFAFALNDYFDAPYDAVDVKKKEGNYFVNRTVSPGIVGGICALITLVLLLVFSQFGLIGIGLLLLSYLAMWAYSAPPLRLKNKPGFDLLMHTLFVQTYPYILCLVLIGAAWTLLDGAILTIISLASLTAQLEQQMRDFAADRQHEVNFTIMAGLKWSLWLLKSITAVLLLTTFYFVVTGVIPWYLLPFGVIGLPALIHRFWREEETPRSERLVVLSTTTGFLYTGFIFWYFLIQGS